MKTLIGFKRVVFAAVTAGFAATALAVSWEIDVSANPKTLTCKDDSENVLWKFQCTTSGNDVSITKYVSGEGVLDLNGMPEGYRIVDINRDQVKTVTMLIDPDMLPKLVDFQFYYASNFTNFTGGGAVETIGNNAFTGRSGIKHPIYFPNCKSVGIAAFQNCKGVPEFRFPKLTQIAAKAFEDCSGCTNCVFNWAEVTTIGDSAFCNDKWLKGDLVMPKLTYLNGLRNTKVTLVYAPNAKKIGHCCAYSATSLTNLVVGACLEEIEGNSNFSGCTALKGDFCFPLVTSFPGDFFRDVKGVKSIIAPKANSFNSTSFHECQLTNAVVGAPTSIPNKLFDAASNNFTLHISGDCPTFGINVFSGTGSSSYRNSPARAVRIYVHGAKFVESWRNACFALRGTDEFEPYRAYAPKRTAGIMYAAEQGASESQRDLAYVVNGNRTGFGLIVN